MPTLSVPLTEHLETFITRMVKQGHAANKADLVRRALLQYEEEEAVFNVLRAEQEVRDGKAIRGNLRTILKKMA
jgi:Arc/MetJ-type ribon-helix-helix transcriptional regulator